jgi:hypothetical protein
LLERPLQQGAGTGRIALRIGLDEAAATFGAEDDLVARIAARPDADRCARVFGDAAQVPTPAPVRQLARGGGRPACACGAARRTGRPRLRPTPGISGSVAPAPAPG